jgi:Fe-S cluster assembly ATP-binding protein
MIKTLEITNLHASVDGEPILKGVNLKVSAGEIHCIMGPNGSGKSTLVNTIMGHPAYEVTEGEILLNGENVLEMEPFERAQAGIFLAFQYPKEIAGVSMLNFLTAAYNAHLLAKDPEAKPMKAFRFKREIKAQMEELKIDPAFLDRFLNQGFSGGEKKKAEILQLKLLQPTFALLDETDSGLDVDALKIVAEGINSMKGDDFGVLLVTHYQRILDYVEPHFVHVMIDGKIVKSASGDYAKELESTGYEQLIVNG